MADKPILYMETTYNYYNVCPDYIEQFRKLGYDVRFFYGQEFSQMSRDQIMDIFRDCEVASVCLSPITREMIEQAPKLKLICTFGAGTDHIDVEAATERGIPVVNGRGGGAISVAEMVVSMMMALARNFPEYDYEMRHGIWRSRLAVEMFGKTAGILGVGAIGSELVRILHDGFRMRILANDVVPNQELIDKYGVEYTSQEKLFREADFISIHTPLLPSTRGLINDEKLSIMKPTAFLINASRGGIVDEQALLRALRDKKIAGAGLDVFEKEPYIDNQFAEFRNVITTTHCAANTPETVYRIARMLTENIKDVLSGKPPRQNVVNPISIKSAINKKVQ